MPSPAKVWLVTGASSVLGRAVAEHALQQGDNVVATLHESEVLSDLHSPQLLVLSLDVSRPEQIHAAFENALGRFGRVDIVFNNADMCIMSEAEGMSDERGREMFDVLFWGPTNVTKEAVNVLRERNYPPGGHLMQVSSWTALQAVPGIAHYAAAKAGDCALECLSEGLAAELDPSWGIKISIAQPGLFRTNATWATAIDPINHAYSDPDLPSRKARSEFLGKSTVRPHEGDPKRFAWTMHQLARMDDPPLYVPLHRVAVEAAKTRGEGLIRTAEEYASWSEDVYFPAAQ